MKDHIATRLSKLRAALEPMGIDALLIGQPENRTYMSGFTGSAGWLLVSRQGACLAADFRYWGQVARECPGIEILPFGQVFAQAGLPTLLERAGGRRIGFEADYLTYAEARAWMEQAPDYEWVPTRGVVAGLRAIKDAGEIADLRAAVALADEALAYALGEAQAGMTERELAWVIESYIRAHGGENVAFPLIVGCGPNGAEPHHHSADFPLTPGQPIVIDMGACVNGYRSDLTRTVCLSEPADPGRFWAIYNTVLRAQMAAEAAVRPGLTCQQVDSIARDMIAKAGYGEYFGHGLGHGVGLAIHEDPFLRQSGTALLAAGQVLTIEPGIYLPDWGGVRIEDIILVTGNGAEVLTRAPKEPII
jgi:Xaa-Pro aminopeptidase